MAAPLILFGLPVAGAVAIGAVVRARRAVGGRRSPRRPHIDPFALSEPWHTFVAHAQRSRRRFQQAIGRARPGPLRTRLEEIAARIDDAVQECWQVASAGDSLADALEQIHVAQVKRELDTIMRSASERDSTKDATVAALRAQLAAGDRLRATITDARSRLQLLDARLDESVARAIELSVSSDASALDSLSADVDGIVGDMEALRIGIAEADAASDGGA
jgi:hypothetical protein